MTRGDFRPRAWVVMGVAGAGKSTLAAALRDALASSYPRRPAPVFIEGDDHHAAESKAKMSRGESLTEADRAPWLRSIADAISLETRARVGVGGGGGGGPDAPDASAAPPRDVVVACSALKRAHRDVLASVPGVETRFIFLSPATREAAAARLRTRAAADPGGHFAGEALLASQLADLESDAASFEGHHVHRMRAFGGRGENEEEDDGDGDAAAAAVAAAAAAAAVEATAREATNHVLDVVFARAAASEGPDGSSDAPSKPKRPRDQRNGPPRLDPSTLTDDVRAFMDEWWARLCARGVSGAVPDAANAIDHVCWRCETAEEYHDAVKALADAGHDVAGTKSIGGRPITTVRLKAPVRWARFQIPAIEVPAPKAFRPRPRGFEHAEVALLCDADGFTETNAIEAFLSKFPDLEWNRDGVRKAINPDVSLSLGGGVAVKFHNRPLLDVVDFERASGLLDARCPHTPSIDDGYVDPLSPFEDVDALFGLEMKQPWADLVVSGAKTMETRAYALPPRLLGKPVALLRTPAAKDGEPANVSSLGDACDPGAATIVALVTFTSVKEWDSAKDWAADGDKHLVPSDDEAFRWRRGDGLRRRVRGWIVGDVAPIAPTPSPKMTRALRSLFKLEFTADELLVKGIDDRGGGGGGGAVGDDDEEDDDAGIFADDGANDRPWH